MSGHEEAGRQPEQFGFLQLAGFRANKVQPEGMRQASADVG